MIVKQVKDIAREWIIAYAEELPRLRGAILAGSINWMADDASWSPASDTGLLQ